MSDGESLQNGGTLALARKRLEQVFGFLRELNDLRNPTTVHINDYDRRRVLWLDTLPDHPSVRRATLERTDQDIEIESDTSAVSPPTTDSFVLRVRRPRLTPCPEPPDELREWLQAGWDHPEKSVQLRESRNEVVDGEPKIIEFGDYPEISDLLHDWQLLRDKWAVNEQPTRQALNLFEKLYEWHGIIERESDRVELVVGDGYLRWDRTDSVALEHPILLQRLQLDFDPDKPEFVLRDTDHSPELYMPVFRSVEHVDGKPLGRCRDDLASGQYHPLEEEATSGFLRRLVQVLLVPFGGEFEPDTEAVARSCPKPVVARRPIVVLRNRTAGFATAIDAILEDVPERDAIPKWFQEIVGVVGHDEAQELDVNKRPWHAVADEDVLFSKPSNAEQARIARRLDQHGCALVQGPPGTGKTHTIANLVGHLLAQNQSVLITAHTAKALRVLREKVVDRLQPLCVAVLESDRESRDQLEGSVQGILSRLDSDVELLEDQAKKVARQRSELLKRHGDARQRLLEARFSEYQPVIIDGEEYSPKDAAKRLKDGVGCDDWIPGPVQLGASLPLSVSEVLDLYRTSAEITHEDEQELDACIPRSADLPTLSHFEFLVDEYARLVKAERDLGDDLWDSSQGAPTAEHLQSVAQHLLKVSERLRQGAKWQLEVIQAGRYGGASRETWDDLLGRIEETWNTVQEGAAVVAKYGPSLDSELDSTERLRVLEEILAHLERGGGLGFGTLMFKRDWKAILAGAKIEGRAAKTVEDFRVLHKLAKMEYARDRMAMRWDRQMASLGVEPFGELGPQPVNAIHQYAHKIKSCLDWYAKSWIPAIDALKRCGFRWEQYIAQGAINLDEHGELLRIADIVQQSLGAILQSRCDDLVFACVTNDLGKARDLLAYPEEGVTASVVVALREALDVRDSVGYGIARARLMELEHKQTVRQRRRELSKRLEDAAPGWAAAIRSRQAPHDNSHPPNENIQAAWSWRQIHEELEKRAENSLELLLEQLDGLCSEVLETTAELVDCQAWAGQIKRTKTNQRQALMGWLQTIRRIGKGTGKRVPRLLREARELMNSSRHSVPVWIMPLSRIVENFDPASTRFNVVIIDEASQSDAMAYIALYMADRVVIVGDNEQVSPQAVGQMVEPVEQLIDTYLRGIPNGHLYDGQMSIFDVAAASFGSVISLREHFRCVPEIIHFSNDLAYFQPEKRLIPLRDSSDVVITPAVVAYRAEGRSENKRNHAEALVVVSLIAAAIEQPEYQFNRDGTPVSFGVISMVGDDQSTLIFRLLHEHVPEGEIYNRRILCGNPAHFQGDERDVVLLSLVDGPPENPPLSIRRDERFKKRYNVAASRARDQMWVVYSMNPDIDLQEGDLRKSLVTYALDPEGHIRECEREEAETESPFELDVLRRLRAAGFRVVPQWKVGPKRIDLVVRGGGKALAIECDGDRYHTLDNLRDDMERQALLERQGWKFVRIRGSVFYRDPDRAMRPVFRRLEQLGIPPEDRDLVNNPEMTNDLLERVKRRAQELRMSWTANEKTEDVSEDDDDTDVNNSTSVGTQVEML